MNYAQARQRNDGSGYWDWTTQNDDLVWRSEPCSVDCKHATSTEAEQHFYNYCLEHVEESEYAQDYPCDFKGCSNLSHKGLGNDAMSLTFRTSILCDEHRSKETLRLILPFKSGLRLMHS